MHANAEAVVRSAAERGVVIEPREFPDGTRTADDAARAIGVAVGQIVKSLVFRVDDEVVVALVSGANQLDERLLAAAAGAPEGAKATRTDAGVVRASTGYPIGGVPPFGHAEPLRVFVDRDLLDHPVVWAAAGTPHDNFSIAPDDLVTVSGGDVCDLARRVPSA